LQDGDFSLLEGALHFEHGSGHFGDKINDWRFHITFHLGMSELMIIGFFVEVPVSCEKLELKKDIDNLVPLSFRVHHHEFIEMNSDFVFVVVVVLDGAEVHLG
jgi:hypothetical protein